MTPSGLASQSFSKASIYLSLQIDSHGWTNHREQMWFACQLQTLLGYLHIKSNLLYSEETDY